MNDIETRLREAFRADAEIVQTIRPLTRADQRDMDDLRPRQLAGGKRRGHMLIPFAAAATVAAILAGIGVAVPKIWPGSESAGPMTASAVAAGFLRGKIPAASPPRFLLALVPKRPGNALRLETISTSTGHVIARIGAPAPDRYYVYAAPQGNDRTFILAAAGTRCQTWFYRMTFTAQGRPESVATLLTHVPGRADSQVPIAVSANGRLLAYATNTCRRRDITKNNGRIGVINITTGAGRTWRFRWPAQPASLSLSANGQVLGLVSNPSNGASGASVAFNRAWVLRTSSRSGRLELHYRRVFGPHPWPIVAVISPNARLVWTVTGTFHRHPFGWSLKLSGYTSATGKVIGNPRVLHRVRELGPDTLTADVSGRYLLFANGGSPMRWIDLATGRLVTIAGRAANLPLDVAW